MPNPPVTNANAEAIGLATLNLVKAYLAKYPAFTVPDGFAQRIQRFATELARWGTRLNLTAAPDDPAALAVHILDSMMPLLLASRDSAGPLAKALVPAQRILDLGSGAGFPGLVLATATEAEFVLTEARRKRASFLNVAAAAMGLANVRVDNCHLTSLMPEFDVVTARAFAQPAEFYEIAPTALKPGGSLMLYASLRQRPEIQDLLGSRHVVWTVYEYQLPRLSGQPTSSRGEPHHLIVVSRAPG